MPMEVYDTYGNGMMGRDNTSADPTLGRWEVYTTATKDETNNTMSMLLAKGDGNFTRRQVTPFDVITVTDSNETKTSQSRIRSFAIQFHTGNIYGTSLSSTSPAFIS
jgi:hypothetical protein